MHLSIAPDHERDADCPIPEATHHAPVQRCHVKRGRDLLGVTLLDIEEIDLPGIYIRDLDGPADLLLVP